MLTRIRKINRTKPAVPHSNPAFSFAVPDSMLAQFLNERVEILLAMIDRFQFFERGIYFKRWRCTADQDHATENQQIKLFAIAAQQRYHRSDETGNAQ
jgi:hypothetical protein